MTLVNDWIQHDSQHFWLRVLARLRAGVRHRALVIKYKWGTDARVHGEKPVAILNDGRLVAILGRDTASSRGWVTPDGIIRSYQIRAVTTLNEWSGYASYRSV